MRRDGRVHRDLRYLRFRQGITYPSCSRLLEDEILAIHQSLNPLDRIFLPILHDYPSALCLSSLLPLSKGHYGLAWWTPTAPIRANMGKRGPMVLARQLRAPSTVDRYRPGNSSR